MFGQRRLLCFRGFTVEVTLIGHQRHFGVNNDLFVLRQVNHHIRLITALLFIFQADLGGEFMAFPQTGGFQDTGKNRFPPVPLHFVIAFQGIGEIDRFLCHPQIELLQTLNFMCQGVPFTAFLAVTFLNLPVKVIQLFTERAQQHRQALAVEFIRPAAALFKDAGSQVFKLGIQALLTVEQQPLFFFGCQAALFQPGGQLTDLGFLLCADMTGIFQ